MLPPDRDPSGADPRHHGSGHTGGLNTLRQAGLWAGVLTTLLDIALGFAAVRAQDLGATNGQLGILTTAVQVAKAIPAVPRPS